MLDAIRAVDAVRKVAGSSVPLVAGNVCTAEGTRALIEAGADVVLGARRVDRLPDTGRLVEVAGRRYAALQTDVTSPEQATALVQKAVDEVGRVDVLVHNAGLGWA
ncbi:MAG: SDR family NAD(P)-dependent oxidoreductase, partial [Proteobacteria bacterium]|nr:SDR family NAD(P)-dependent oxidoreductase [Pseudomonadota bacterium]